MIRAIRISFRILLITTAAGLMAACGGREHSRDSISSTSFDAFARSLFEEMERRPVVDSMDVELGLFGDLDVMAGENLVMGRYRYRVDSTSEGLTGRLSFLVRPRGTPEAIPVILTFEPGGGSWEYRNAAVVRLRGDAQPTPTEEMLERRLDAWTEGATREVSQAAASR